MFIARVEASAVLVPRWLDVHLHDLREWHPTPVSMYSEVVVAVATRIVVVSSARPRVLRAAITPMMEARG